MVSESGFVCIVAIKDSFLPNNNHKYLPNNKKGYKIDTCDWSEGYSNNFMDFPLTASTELVNSYNIYDYKSVAIFCREKFLEDKIKTLKKDFYYLNQEDLGKLKVFLTQMEFRLIEIINDEIHMKDENKKRAEWVKNLVLKRNEYAQSSSYKKFTMRHHNKLSAMKWLIPRSFLIGLIFFPLVIMIAEAFGAENSWLFPTCIYSALYFYTLWLQGYEDETNKEEILGNEKSVIRHKLSYSHFR